MRSTDEPVDTFGKIAPKPAPVQKPIETWTPVERGSVIERNQDGRLRTNDPKNTAASWPCRHPAAVLELIDALEC